MSRRPSTRRPMRHRRLRRCSRGSNAATAACRRLPCRAPPRPAERFSCADSAPRRGPGSAPSGAADSGAVLARASLCDRRRLVAIVIGRSSSASSSGSARSAQPEAGPAPSTATATADAARCARIPRATRADRCPRRARLPPPEPDSAQLALEALDSLPVVDGYADAPYRPRAGSAQTWADVDRNGCDTRNDILGRDLLDPVFKPGRTTARC